MVPLQMLRIAALSAFLFTSVSAHCETPKVRKEWRRLCREERAAWIKAVNCVANLPHDPDFYTTVDPAISLIPPVAQNSSRWDDFVYANMDLNVLIHGTGFFLPWHRLYVQSLEDEMRTKCGYEGTHPYWDWRKDAPDFYHTTLFSDDEIEGLGSWGDPDNDNQISTGGFKDLKLAYPVPHHIRRNFLLQPFLTITAPVMKDGPVIDPGLLINTTFTYEAIDALVNSYVGDYIHFQGEYEGVPFPHSGPHFILGGDMAGECPFGLTAPTCIGGPRWPPNDPLFFLHHAMIDKVWREWQNKNPMNKYAFAGGSVSAQVDADLSFAEYPNGGPPFLNTSSLIPSDGLWEDTTVADVLDTTGGRLCYVYE